MNLIIGWILYVALFYENWQLISPDRFVWADHVKKEYLNTYQEEPPSNFIDIMKDSQEINVKTLVACWFILRKISLKAFHKISDFFHRKCYLFFFLKFFSMHKKFHGV